jgi:hypothetical protein
MDIHFTNSAGANLPRPRHEASNFHFWLPAFKSVKILAITFDVWRKWEEDLPDWSKADIMLVEERVGKKVSVIPCAPSNASRLFRSFRDLMLRWTVKGEERLVFT